MPNKLKSEFCIVCQKPNPHKRTKTCSKECREERRRQTHSDPEFKKRISDIRKEHISKNPDSFHWARADKFRSIPCEHFKKKLTSEGIHFVEEFQPLEERFYRIDIAFPHHKLGVEINGTQHYESGGKVLKPYYQERHDLIEAAGWKLIEVYHTNVWREEIVEDIIRTIKAALAEEEFDYASYEKPIKKTLQQKKAEESKARTDAKKLEYEERLPRIRQAIINADPSQVGWAARAAHELGCLESYVRRIKNQHFKDIVPSREQRMEMYREVLLKYPPGSSKDWAELAGKELNRNADTIRTIAHKLFPNF